MVTETNATSSGGVDTVISRINYTLGSNIENLTLIGLTVNIAVGNELNNTIKGNAVGNQLYGLAGNDLIYVGSGTASDLIDGGVGVDGLSYAYATSAVKVDLNLTTAQATGGSGSDTILNVENLYGSAYGDTIKGNKGGNQLYGAAGNDLIYVGSGTASDRIDGGSGIDSVSYTFALSAVKVDLNLAIAQATGGSGSDTIINIENLYGSNFNDTLTDGVGNNAIYGNNGNDMIIAGAGIGNDTYHGGTGVDGVSYINATSGVTIKLDVSSVQNTQGAGNDTLLAIENLYGSSFNDIFTDGVGSNALFGNSGNDLMYAAAGLYNDIYNGGIGVDALSYAAASAGITIDLGISGIQQDTQGAGLDTISGVENLYGTKYADVLKGSYAANHLFGGEGNDTLQGFGGNDTLWSGSGNDTLTGGVGRDSFVFNAALNASTNTDLITDFIAVDDTIILENAIFTKLTVLGTLATANFCANATGVAADSNDFICYNTATGMLSYDADGNGAGASVAFAVLGSTLHPALTAADFAVV